MNKSYIFDTPLGNIYQKGKYIRCSTIDPSVEWVVKNYGTKEEKWYSQVSGPEWIFKKYSLEERSIEQFRRVIEEKIYDIISGQINSLGPVLYDIFKLLYPKEILMVRQVCRTFRQVIDIVSTGEGSVLQQRFVINLGYVEQLVSFTKCLGLLLEKKSKSENYLSSCKHYNDYDARIRFVANRSIGLNLTLIPKDINDLISLIEERNVGLKYISVIYFSGFNPSNIDCFQNILNVIFDNQGLFPKLKAFHFDVISYPLIIPGFQYIEELCFSGVFSDLIIGPFPALKKLEYYSPIENAGCAALLKLEPRGSSKIIFCAREKDVEELANFIADPKNEARLAYIKTIVIDCGHGEQDDGNYYAEMLLGIIHENQNMLNGLTRIELDFVNPGCVLEIPEFSEFIEVVDLTNTKQTFIQEEKEEPILISYRDRGPGRPLELVSTRGGQFIGSDTI